MQDAMPLIDQPYPPHVQARSGVAVDTLGDCWKSGVRKLNSIANKRCESRSPIRFAVCGDFTNLHAGMICEQ
jgi:hypothetical protein